MNHSVSQPAGPHEAKVRVLRSERRIENEKLRQLKIKLQATADAKKSVMRAGWRSQNGKTAALRLTVLLCAAFFILALGACLDIRGLGNAHSILGLGFTPVGGLSCRYPVRVLVSGSTSACIWVHGSGSPTIAANGLTTRVFDAVLAKQTQSKKHTRYHH
jgi:hypothetical protein